MDSKSLDTSRRNSKRQSKRQSKRKSRRSSRKSAKSSRRPSRSSRRTSRSSRRTSRSSRRSSKSSKKYSLNSDLSRKCSKSEKRLKKAAKSAKRSARTEAFESNFDIMERSDGFGAMIVYGFQLVHLVYCVSSIIFHSFFNQTSTESNEWKTIILMTVGETCSMILVLLVLFYRTPGFRCTVLLFQYLFVFGCFSMFLKVISENQYSNQHSFGLIYFSSTTLYGLSGFVHSLILMFALDFVGSAKMDDDFSEKYIIETKEKRKQKLYLMMAELLKSAVLTQPSANVGVMVTDETGLPVKIDGSVLKSDVNRKISLTLGNDSMKLASTSMVESTLSVPSEKVAPVQTVKIIKKNEPVYNHCTEQKDHFSPRVL